MTKFLSQALQATEPQFRLQLSALERRHGNPGMDIRLSLAAQKSARQKLLELQLDPADTTPQELYQALKAKLNEQDRRLVKMLRTRAAYHVSAEADPVAGLGHALQEKLNGTVVFGLKSAVFKALVKKYPPKRAMKALGYRSVESFLKHESAAQIWAAAAVCEPDKWYIAIQAAYKKLAPADFEERPLQIIYSRHPKWRELGISAVARRRHNVLVSPELGSVVLLPLPAEVPAGAITAALVLAARAAHDCAEDSIFLRASKPRSDFGQQVIKVTQARPLISALSGSAALEWGSVSNYLARLSRRFKLELFEPHILPDHLHLPSPETIAASVHDELSFWQGSAAAALIHDGRPVSCNLLDVALNLCNSLTYERRFVHYFQEALRQELDLAYLKVETVEKALIGHMQPGFALEPAIK